MPFDLQIGRERIRIEAPPVALRAVRERYGAFAPESRQRVANLPPISLRIGCDRRGFATRYVRPAAVATRVTDRDAIVFEGGARGRYAPAARRGSIDEATGLGEVDVLVRTALSVALPLSGRLLVHGAALPLGEEGLALCGASGAGKSTAAAAFGAACDELIVLRPFEDGVEMESTPYWAGRPLRRRCAGIVCLERGEPAGLRRLRGAAIARVLARHVVRYAAIGAVDRAILDLLAAVAGRSVVSLASCPEGAAFLPFLGACLGLGAAPRPALAAAGRMP